MRRGLVSLVAISLCVGMLACGGNSNPASPPMPTPTPVPEVGEYTAAVTPDPTFADPTGNPAFPYSFSVTVTVTDVAGLSGNVSGVQVEFGSNAFLNVGANDVVRLAGTNHVNPRGNLRIPISTAYHQIFGLRLIPDLRFTVGVIDDHGHRHTYHDTITVLRNDAARK